MKRRDFVKTMSAVGAGLILQPGSSFALPEEVGRYTCLTPSLCFLRKLIEVRIQSARS